MKTIYECSICGATYDDHDACYEHEKTCPSYYLGHYFEDSVFIGRMIYVAELTGDTFKCVSFSSAADEFIHQTFTISHLCNRAKHRLSEEDVEKIISPSCLQEIHSICTSL